MSEGQTVRLKVNDSSNRRKGEIAKSLHFRSYDVEFDDGTTSRRTSKHVRFSSEAPLIDFDDMPDTVLQQRPLAGLMPLPRSTRDDRAARPRPRPHTAQLAMSCNRPARHGSHGRPSLSQQTAGGTNLASLQRCQVEKSANQHAIKTIVYIKCIAAN